MGKSLKSISDFMIQNKKELIIVIIILLVATFLRLYKIREFIIFLGDEGRDALVVKRMIVDHDFTLLGPTASVGGFYLGPVYYYFMIPFLWVFNFDPVGPAIMVALLGVATVGLLYFAMREWFNSTAATITTAIYATAPGIVRTSRSSWNPNIMPFFSLLAMFSLSLALKTKKSIYFIVGGIAFGIAIQSHYLGLILGPIMAFATLILLPRKYWIKSAALELVGFIMGASMFLAFELRHQFPNTKTIFEFVSRGGNTTGPRSLNIFWLFVEMNRRTLESVIPYMKTYTGPVTIAVIISFFWFFIRNRRTKKGLSKGVLIVVVWLVVGMLGIGSYKGQLYPHYFGFLFPLPIILLGVTLYEFTRIKIFKPLVLLTTALILFLNIKNQPMWKKGSNLIDQTKNITAEAIQLSNNKPFNFALIADGNSDHAYRYFLEIMNRKPKTLEEEITEQLIVVCEKFEDPCLPLGYPLWEVAGFGRAEIDKEIIVDPGITIFRLVHHEDSIDSIGKPAAKG